jgi:hypothetical protein
MRLERNSLWLAARNRRRLRCAIIAIARSAAMPSEDQELRLLALERKIDEERQKTESALDRLQQQMRQLKREVQSMNVRVANAAQRR